LDKAGLRKNIETVLKPFSNTGKILLVHSDYTRIDFSNLLTPLIYRFFQQHKLRQLDCLNACGTHRPMSEPEFLRKLGWKRRPGNVRFINHKFDNPGQLIRMGEISADFVREKTRGQLTRTVPVIVNRNLAEEYDLVIVLSATSPHEAAGYSGGLKMLFPGAAGQDIIGLFHWSAVLIGIPGIIGSIENPARDIINEASRLIFRSLKCPLVSFNMVAGEDKKVVPYGLFTGIGMDGFLDAFRRASELSAGIHIRYVDAPLQQAVQIIEKGYDELWTAAKGSYKLQRRDVMAKNSEIIIYAPHIKRFHSNKEMDTSIRSIGYFGRQSAMKFLEQHSGFNLNVAAHVINMAGEGPANAGFRITLATGISGAECRAAGLGYIDPGKIRRQDFRGPSKLWIEKGGKYMYDISKKYNG